MLFLLYYYLKIVLPVYCISRKSLKIRSSVSQQAASPLAAKVNALASSKKLMSYPAQNCIRHIDLPIVYTFGVCFNNIERRKLQAYIRHSLHTVKMMTVLCTTQRLQTLRVALRCVFDSRRIIFFYIFIFVMTSFPVGVPKNLYKAC